MKEIENAIKIWKAKHKESNFPGNGTNANFYSGICTGLQMALDICNEKNNKKLELDACCDSPGREKCEQCQEIGTANPHNH